MSQDLPRETEVVVVGGGQAGIAAGEHLGNLGISYIILERDRVAESWRTRRWDSLRANGPAWHDKFPGMGFNDPDGFASKDEIAAYFEKYAAHIKAPIYAGVAVTSVHRNSGKPGFIVSTSQGDIRCQYVISATGAFHTPLIPALVPLSEESITQMHSIEYKNPNQLPDGAILVVGAGSSGAQIADELGSSGRKVYLSVGAHDRPPRSYRNRDFCWWLGVLNKWDQEAVPGSDHTTIAVSGANGGATMDFRRLASRPNSVTLLGRTYDYKNGELYFAEDLAKNVEAGDANYLSMLDEADAYIKQNGLESVLPPEPSARELLPAPECMTNPIKSLNLEKAGISTIIWATGFENDYAWLANTKAVHVEKAKPNHNRGLSAEPGIYFIGLPWQTRRGSSFIWGVWYDAKYVADHINKQRGYVRYAPEK